MNITLKTIAAVGFALLLSGMSVSSSMGQQVPEAKQLPAVIQYNGDMANLLAHLPGVYGRTIGLEVDPRHPPAKVGFYLKDPSLADVLNAITNSAPIYQWSEREDFIEVVPLRGSSQLLDTHVSNFRVDNAGEAEAINQLVNLPEVQAGMNSMRLRYRGPANSLTGGSGKKMSFTLQDATVRQILNKIANENGSRFWVLQMYSAGGFSISTRPIGN